MLADTVGFISHLPHSLIEAFKATLEEVANADLLLHVVDAGDPALADHISEVDAVLAEIGAAEIPTIMVLNKIDTLTQPCSLIECGGKSGSVKVSALTGEGLDDLRFEIAHQLGVRAPTEVLIAAEDGRTRAWLYQAGAVIEEHLNDDGRLALKLRADDYLLQRLKDTPKVVLQTR